ncbi:MAG: PAS domain S-box protein [Pontiellaceae bacterium]|nr:PAS domain S-box protein [Pontiellaceae bacterium]
MTENKSEAADGMADSFEQDLDRMFSAEGVLGDHSEGIISKVIGKELLRSIVAEFMELVGTSCTIHERTGDLACGIVGSDWCRCLRQASDSASRDSRKGLCHESCWNDISRISIEENRTIETVCQGRMHVFAVPILANGEVVGAIKGSYGSPPDDERALSEISKKYNIERSRLENALERHPVRSDEMIYVARRRLSNSALLIGKLIESHLNERKLRESEALMRLVIKHDPDGVAVLDREMVFRACSDRFLEDYDLVEEDVLGRAFYEVLPTFTLRWREVHDRVLQGGVERKEDDIYKRSDGSVCYTRWECRPWYAEEGEIAGTVFYSEITTERKLAELALYEAKDAAEQGMAELEAVLGHVKSGIVVFDMQEMVVHVNETFARIHGYESTAGLLTDGEFFRKNFQLYSYPERTAVPFEKWPLERLYCGELLENVIYYVQRKDSGRERVVSFYGTPIRNADGMAELEVLILDDMTQQLEARAQLEQSERMHRKLFEASPVGMFVVHAEEERVLNVNSLGCEMLGYAKDDLLEMAPRSYICGASSEGSDYDLFRDAILRGEDFSGITRARRSDGTLFPIEVFGTPIIYQPGLCALVLVKDITERRKREEKDRVMQERMEQTQRLESLGVLAGGIAHDFNNLLMAIIGYADLALMDLSPLSPAASDIAEIKVSSKRAADLCTQLLAYSGKGRLEEKTFSISDLVEEMLHMLKTCISKKCVLNLNLKKDLPITAGDPSQMRQIIMNFVLNASEAIGDRSGVIAVTTSTMVCTTEYFEAGYVLKPEKPGLYVALEVSDNGSGMDAETLNRIFEPFFTTKFSGRGLGLSAVLGIIRSHGGGLRVYSELGVGTTFKVLFPVVQEGSASADLLSVGDEEVADLSWRGHGTVLLVDDEETVRSVCCRKLNRLGFDVLTADNGLDGVALYREKRDEIDLVILDLTMPKMGGEEAFRELRAINPEVKVVLSSGYTRMDVISRFSGKKISGFLRKPFTMGELLVVLSALLPGSFSA